MLTYKALISLFFRCLDLAVVIGCGWFLYRKWGADAVKQEMEAELQGRQKLDRQIEENIERAQNLDKTLLHDYQTVMRLENQVAEWDASCEAAVAARQEQKEQVKAHLLALYEQRITHIKQAAYRKKIIPEALQQAQEELRREFVNSDKAKAFVDKILAITNKEDA